MRSAMRKRPFPPAYTAAAFTSAPRRPRPSRASSASATCRRRLVARSGR